AARIDTLAEQRAGDSITVQRTAQGRLVMVGRRSVFTISPADLDTLRGETLDQASANAVAQLRDALQSERESRSFVHLLTGLGLAVLATLIFAFAVRLLRRMRAFILAALPEVAGPRLPRLAIGTFTLLTADQLLAFFRRLVRLVTWGAELVAAYIWLAYVLTRFPYSRPWGEALGTYLVSTVKEFALTALGAVPGLFMVALIFIVTRWISRLVSALFDAVSAGTVQLTWVDPETAMPTKRIAIALLWLFAIVAAYPYVPGSGTKVFQGISVFLGLMISIGSSGLVNQTMSGLVLIYSRALRPGDYVRVGQIEGTVTALGMLSTKIRTIRLEEITMPNAVVVSSDIKNFSRLAGEHGVIVHTSVTIGYNTPWRQVQAMLLMAAARTDGLRTEPAPFVLQTALSDFYIEYQLNVYLTDPEQRIPVLSRLHAHIVDCFNEHGVQIMSPHYEDDPETPAVVPPEQWYAAPARRENRSGSVGQWVSGSETAAPVVVPRERSDQGISFEQRDSLLRSE
ncbi:MAG TPA: mechanosensitive ion channel domain-containing protein, partial [Gemmatimonadaceae bacterium]|nr:mechanosensitive ion channel domain-containing protein [Gemmatimonadaceae bacterium]